MRIAVTRIAAIGVAAILLAGCAGVRAHRGAVLDPQIATSVRAGVDNKDSVAKTLGRPTFVGQFTPNDWYYVARDTSTFAFRNPRVTDQTVLRIRFDQAGNVTSVDRTGKNMIASINPVNRSTPTLGKKKSFFDEIFGNIGAVGSGAMPGYGGQ